MKSVFEASAMGEVLNTSQPPLQYIIQFWIQTVHLSESNWDSIIQRIYSTNIHCTLRAIFFFFSWCWGQNGEVLNRVDKLSVLRELVFWKVK